MFWSDIFMDSDIGLHKWQEGHEGYIFPDDTSELIKEFSSNFYHSNDIYRWRMSTIHEVRW